MSELDKILFHAEGRYMANETMTNAEIRAEAKAAIVKLILDVIGEDDPIEILSKEGPAYMAMSHRNDLRRTQRQAVAKLEGGGNE